MKTKKIDTHKEWLLKHTHLTDDSLEADYAKRMLIKGLDDKEEEKLYRERIDMAMQTGGFSIHISMIEINKVFLEVRNSYCKKVNRFNGGFSREFSTSDDDFWHIMPLRIFDYIAYLADEYSADVFQEREKRRSKRLATKMMKKHNVQTNSIKRGGL